MQAIYNQRRIGLLRAERCYLDPACGVVQIDVPDEVYLIRGTFEVLGDSGELEWVNAEKWMQTTCVCGEELYPEDAFLKHKNNDTCLGCAACVRTIPGEQMIDYPPDGIPLAPIEIGGEYDPFYKEEENETL